MAHGNAISRFTDADKEPAQTLTPIEGYEKKPLVSLKEAVASIDTPIHNINGMVWTAERNCDKPSDNLSSDESASIHLYTMEWPEDQDSFYTLLNRKLRSEKRNELRSWYLYLKLFFTALYKLPSIKSIVWRGIRGDATHLYRKDFIWWGVSSCTDSLEVVEKFVGRSGVRTLFMIDCMNGKAIKSHSFYKDENEILLLPGTYLKVIDKCSPADDLHIIRLREETPPYPLVASPFASSSKTPSVDTPRVEKLIISSHSPLNSLDPPAKPHESKPTTLLSSPQKYKNQKLEQKINANKNETELYLGELSLSDEDMEIVGYYISANIKTLTRLDLYKNQIGDKGAQYLSEGLQNNTTLTELDLPNNQIGAQGAQYLSEGLQKNTTLITLSLSNNQIGDKGAQYLGEGLQKNTTLTQLYLRGNRIGDKGAQYLGEGLQKNTTLITLFLDNNQIGAPMKQHLQKIKQQKGNLSLYL